MEKINVAELLKDCPKGMELDCTMFENVFFDCVTDNPIYPIRLYVQSEKDSITLTSFGCTTPSPYAKCVIFPKGKTTWEGFQRPFKDGDIVTWKDRGSLIAFIYKERKNAAVVKHHFALYTGGLDIFKDGEIALVESELVFATEEEKAKLFDAIKKHGYKWNEETKTLEKLPKFKVGDRITDKNKFIYRITEITDKGYKLHDLKTTFITFEEADWYFVKVVDIFDIDTLKPFESKVLVRDYDDRMWNPAFWGKYLKDSRYSYLTSGGCYKQCIPYEGNEHLLGTTNDCDVYFKTWE